MEGKPVMILLVEDDDDHAELATRSLGEHHVGNVIRRLVDGQAALDYLRQHGPYSDPVANPRPDVVLLDLRLPKIDGLEVLRQIKESRQLRRIPVVVLTTSDKESDVAKAYDLHANAYLVKPVDFGKLLDLMRDLGFFWLVWNRTPTLGADG
jgi:CheY-like chemotaxis protein